MTRLEDAQGGGSWTSWKHVSEAILIMAVLLASCFMVSSVSGDDPVYGGDYTGSGTEDDPFSGTVVFSNEVGNVGTPFDYYFTVGTTIEYVPNGPSYSIGSWHIDDGYGLSIDVGHVTGTITKAGTIKVTNTQPGGTILEYEIYAVEPFHELVFESDPGDGVIRYVG